MSITVGVGASSKDELRVSLVVGKKIALMSPDLARLIASELVKFADFVDQKGPNHDTSKSN
jgi:hypothetical protein